MASALRPANEAERIRSLLAHDVLDTPDDPYLVRLTHFAAREFSMPMALVNLVDVERQWTMSAYGFPRGLDVPRSLAFCSITILSPDRVTVIPDARFDPRVANNPAVTPECGIRFYAGAPITDSEGLALGTLCVLDTEPRSFSPAAADALAELAKDASSRFELYRAAAALRESEIHHRHAVELNPQIPWTASAAGKMEEASSRWQAITGLSPASPRGDSWTEAVHPDDLSAVQAAWAVSLPSGKPLDHEYRLRLADGSYRWFRSRAAPRRDDAGRIIKWYGTLEDIHDGKLADLALQESEKRLRFALEAGKFGAWEVDFNTRRVTASDLCAFNFGLRRGEDLSDYDRLIESVHPADRERRSQAIERALAAGEAYEVEYRNIWPDGSIHWIRITGRGVYSEDGTPMRAVGLSLDITDQRRIEEERLRAEAKLLYLAHHDALTGVANRRLLNDRLSQALDLADPDNMAALLCIDLDNFRAANDALGHDTGDGLLRLAADRIGSCLRPTDTVARYVGNKFAVLRGGVTCPSEVDELAHQILQVLSEPTELNGHTVVLGGSIGIAFAPGDASRPERLLRNADTALYRAKTTSRGSYRHFESEMDMGLQARQALKLSLRDALEKQAFRLFFQPLIELSTGRLVSFEALLRWEHPTRGLLSPAEFIPLAEETGLIVGVGRWALTEACRAALSWPEAISVSVNLSVVQFNIGNLEADVVAALASTGLAANRLELEVTETLLLQDTSTNAATLLSLRRKGVRIVMDDFGTGYSSLSYLRTFAFDKVKIDKSLISGLPDRNGGDAIVQAIIGLCRNLRTETTAEGVETRAQLEFLKAQGCTQAQGYLFSPPVPASALEALLRRVWLN
jgi:diguanylate cyclase (GGDEF)-like protein/PAS domain S-box-containing protein